MRYALIAAIALLAACATPAQRAERVMAIHGPYCDKLGFQRDTDPWRNCVMQQANAAQAASSAAYSTYQQSRPRTCVPNGSGVTCY